MKLSDLKNTGHWPTLLAAFLYFDFSFMVWAVLGPLGAQIGETLNLSLEQKGLMVALPILAGAVLRVFNWTIGRSCRSQERWDNGAARGYNGARTGVDLWTA